MRSKQRSGWAEERPFWAVALTTLVLIVALGAAGTALFLYGQQQGQPELLKQVPPPLLVFPFFALWLAYLFWGRGFWREVSPRRFQQLGAADGALLALPLLVVVVNLFDAQTTLAWAPNTLAYYAAFCALVAFVEEGLYRGLFIKWLLPRGWSVAVWVSSAVFWGDARPQFAGRAKCGPDRRADRFCAALWAGCGPAAPQARFAAPADAVALSL